MRVELGVISFITIRGKILLDVLEETDEGFIVENPFSKVQHVVPRDFPMTPTERCLEVRREIYPVPVFRKQADFVRLLSSKGYSDEDIKALLMSRFGIEKNVAEARIYSVYHRNGVLETIDDRE